MASVSVNINGKMYRMACDEGQEKHLEDLAARFDRYVSHLKTSFGDIGDQRLVVMAAIMVTDEMLELERKSEGLSEELAAAKNQVDQHVEKLRSGENDVAKSILEAAEKIESINSKLTTS